nr:ATP-binding cassette domain-containing protein [Chthonobacter albigriseus]
MKAYWLSDRWKEAWLLTVAVVALTAAASKSGVWVAEASGAFIASIASFHDKPNVSPFDDILNNALLLIGFAALKTVVFLGVRHYLLTSLHRCWRRWLDGQFNDALFSDGRAYFHLLSNGQAGDGRLPDNVDQRIQEATKVVTGGALGLAVGLIGVVTSVYFVGEKILEMSTPVQGLEFLGNYAGLVLVFFVIGVYVPTCTFAALWIGRKIQALNVEMQKSEGTYRAELAMLTRRWLQVAAAFGERVQRRIHAHHYTAIDSTWRRQNTVSAGFLSFNLFYNFVTQRVVSYIPILPAYMQGGITFRGYITGSELVNELINDCSWLIQVMPDVASLRASASRITELARAIELVQDTQTFYEETGISDFRHVQRPDVAAFAIRGLELMHQGHDAKPFLTVPALDFEPGQWVFVSGPSGCGKSSLVKAMNGLWPYGRGEVVTRPGAKHFYACQDFRLPQTSLRQLLTMPDIEAEHDDLAIAAVMGLVGLGEFATLLSAEFHRGRRWDEVLSGGQKQKLILARILIQKPDVIFLDEATSALDKGARDRFHRLVKEHCPMAVVISVMHEPVPPADSTGVPFYGTMLVVSDGVAALRPVNARAATVVDQRRTISRGRVIRAVSEPDAVVHLPAE